MNIPNLTQLRDFIQKNPDRFNMVTWTGYTHAPTSLDLGAPAAAHPDQVLSGEFDKIHNCGTVMCIGGWAEVMFCPKGRTVEGVRREPDNYYDGARIAARYLGLTPNQATALFTPPYYHQLYRYTAQMAVETLDHLISTGEVRWNV